MTVVASRYASYYPQFKQGQLIQQYNNNKITNISQLNKEQLMNEFQELVIQRVNCDEITIRMLLPTVCEETAEILF